MKEYSHIEDLLERYYNAQTSEAEEQRLKDFFAHEEVPDHLQAEKEMFQQLQVPEGLEERLSKQIDQWDDQEHRTLKRHRSFRLQWVGIAASLLLLIGMGWHLNNPTPAPRKDTCATPEEAYAQAEKALVMLSTALNKGMGKMEVIQETSERIENNFYKHLNKLNDAEI